VRYQEGMLEDENAPVKLQLNKDHYLELKDYKISKEKGAVKLEWKGEEPNHSVTLSLRGKSVTGIIYTGEKVYSVEPLGNGLQAMVLLDQTKFPDEHPPTDKGKDAKKNRK
jgi:hypothetical protein